ncbi:MAG: hypothetical protein HS111_22055 [Kofleriaceae bacterium]|nr:hypothetical protein [Kofleriaceae bacterium]
MPPVPPPFVLSEARSAESKDALRIVLVTDRHLMGGAAGFAAAIAAAVRDLPPGAALVQVREKDLGGAALLALVRAAMAAAPAHRTSPVRAARPSPVRPEPGAQLRVEGRPRPSCRPSLPVRPERGAQRRVEATPSGSSWSRTAT